MRNRTNPYSYRKALTARHASAATVQGKLNALYAVHSMGRLPARALGPKGAL